MTALEIIRVLQQQVKEKDDIILKLMAVGDLLERNLPIAEAGLALIEKGDAEQRQAIAHLEQSLREKDDIIQAQYAELASTRGSLDKAVDMLNEMRAELDRRRAA